MTLKNAINLSNRLVSETTKKSEIKVYQDFIHILTSLEKRNLSESEVQSIETELDTLDLNSTTTNKKRHFSKALQQFKKYLKNTFSLITKGYYTNLAITFGSSIGSLFGIIFLSSLERSLGISLGISVGTLIGLSMVFGFWYYRFDGKQLGEAITNKLILNYPDIDLVFGVPIFIILGVILMMVLLAYLGGRIYNWEVY